MSVNYTSASGSFVPQNVTLYATPQNDATALNVLALFAQDSYSVRRLTLTGGIRFEQLEGYLPDQASPASPFAAAGVGGFAAQPREYPAIRNVVKWNTAGPRGQLVYDISGDGRTAVKAAAGRYYYILSTGGGGVTQVNRNANYSETYGWNDANGDHKFQLGEQTGTPVVSSVFNPTTGEISFAWDLPRWHRGLLAALRTDLERPVVFENDVNLAAIAESHSGAAKGVGDFALASDVYERARAQGIGIEVDL